MKKITKSLGLILLFGLGLFVLASCKDNKKETLLAPENVAVSGEYVITFDAVEHAVSYQLKLGKNQGEASVSTVQSGDSLASKLRDAGTYHIAVRAVGDEKQYLTSEYSADIQVVIHPEVQVNVLIAAPKVDMGGTFDFKTLFEVKVGQETIEVTDEMITQKVDFQKAGKYPVTLKYEANGKKAEQTVQFEVVDRTVSIKITNVLPEVMVGESFNFKTLFEVYVGAQAITVTDEMISHDVKLDQVGNYNVTIFYERNGQSAKRTITFRVVKGPKELLNDALSDSFDQYTMKYSYSLVGGGLNEAYRTDFYFYGDKTKIVYHSEEGEETVYVTKIGTDKFSFIYYDTELEVWLETTCNEEALLETYGVAFEQFDIREVAQTDLIYVPNRDIFIPINGKLDLVGKTIFGSYEELTHTIITLEITLNRGRIYEVYCVSEIEFDGTILRVEQRVLCSDFQTTEFEIPEVTDLEDLVPEFHYVSVHEGSTSLEELEAALSIEWINFYTKLSVQYLSPSKNIYNNFTQENYFENGLDAFMVRERSGSEIAEYAYRYYEKADVYFMLYLAEQGVFPFPASYSEALEAAGMYAWEDFVAMFVNAESLITTEDGFFEPANQEIGYMMFQALFGEIRSTTKDVVTVNYFKLRVEEGKLVGVFAQVKNVSGGVSEYYTIDTRFGDYDSIELDEAFHPEFTDLELAFADAETTIKEIKYTITDGTTSEVYTITSYQNNAYIIAPNGSRYYVERDPEYVSYVIYYQASGKWNTAEIYLNNNQEWVYDKTFPIPTVVLSYWSYTEDGYLFDMANLAIPNSELENTYDVDDNDGGPLYDLSMGYLVFGGKFITVQYNQVISIQFTVVGTELTGMKFVYQDGNKTYTITLEIQAGTIFRFPNQGASYQLTEAEKTTLTARLTRDHMNSTSAIEFYASIEDYEAGSLSYYEEIKRVDRTVEYYFFNGEIELLCYLTFDEEGMLVSAIDEEGALLEEELLDELRELFQEKYASYLTIEMFEGSLKQGKQTNYYFKDQAIDEIIEYYFGDFGYIGDDFVEVFLAVVEDNVILLGVTMYGEIFSYSFGDFGKTVIQLPEGK